MTKQQFLSRVEAHLRRTKEAPSSFGKRVLGDRGWIIRLRKGAEPREATRNKVLTAMKGTK